MKNFPKWKMELIKFIAGREPILLNFCLSNKNVPPGMSVVYLPAPGEKFSADQLGSKAFLFPIRSIEDNK